MSTISINGNTYSGNSIVVTMIAEQSVVQFQQ